MLSGELEVVSTTVAVFDIIKGYRFRKYGMPPNRRIVDRPGATVGSDCELEITDNMLSGGRAIFSLTSTENGVKMRAEATHVAEGERGPGEIDIAPEQYAREVIAEVKRKTKAIEASRRKQSTLRR